MAEHSGRPPPPRLPPQTHLSAQAIRAAKPMIPTKRARRMAAEYSTRPRPIVKQLVNTPNGGCHFPRKGIPLRSVRQLLSAFCFLAGVVKPLLAILLFGSPLQRHRLSLLRPPYAQNDGLHELALGLVLIGHGAGDVEGAPAQWPFRACSPSAFPQGTPRWRRSGGVTAFFSFMVAVNV
ncbi:hypothetical protein MRX96_029420 [Rhipicephalus microplus]